MAWWPCWRIARRSASCASRPTGIRAPVAKAKEITDAQAAAVKDYLVKKGIAEPRIEAVGMGADQPLVPNVTPVYKAKNRRLELHMIR